MRKSVLNIQIKEMETEHYLLEEERELNCKLKWTTLEIDEVRS